MKIAEIIVKPGRRGIDSAKVRELANSMDEIGMINPITVTLDKVLITGAHRLEAARLLGWTDIDATMFDGTDLVIELAEIDENLMRNELHYIDRGNAFKRRDELLTVAGLRAKRGDNRFTDRPAESAHLTTPEIAKSVGISARALQVEKQIATDIIPALHSIIKEKDLPKSDALKIARLHSADQISSI